MTKTLHDKIEIHPGEPPHTTILKIATNATLEEAAELNGGRMYSPEFRADGWKIAVVWYGHDNGRTVHTFPYTFANRYATEGPTANPVHVQPYRNRFLSLACALAEVLGGATAINVDYGFLMTPTQLESLGYRDIRWIKGSPNNYLGWGNEAVFASRRLPDNRVEHLLLRSGNQMVPWAAIRRVPVNGLTVQALLDFLTF